MDRNWIDSARALFISKYGEQEGSRICRVVMPGILGDFRRRLDKALPGVTVTEDYHLEHTKSVVLVKGRKELRGGTTRLFVTEMLIDGIPVALRDLLTGEPGLRL